MTRRIYHLFFASVLLGLTLSGFACGGKEADQPSNAPVGKPAPGEAPPVAAGAPQGEGPAKISEDGAKVQRK